MMIYKLSETGRQVTYAEWRKIGGCGMPNSSNAMNGNLGPMARWDIHKITLGDIEDSCPYTGRCFARFAVEHLSRTNMSVPYSTKP